MMLALLPLLLSSAQFAPLEPISTPVRDLAGTVAADFDGDGDLDLIAVDRSGRGSVFLEATSPGTFAPAKRVDLGDLLTRGAVAGELTGDAHQDLLVVMRQGMGELMLFGGRGDGTFDPPRSLGDLFPGFNGTPRLVDLDRDGRVDILACGRGGYGAPVTLYQNLGGGAFAMPRELTPTFSNDAQVLDLDADGDLDLLVASIHDDLVVYLNDGTGLFQFGSDLTSFASIDQVELLDLDGDGDRDAIAKEVNSGLVYAFENLGGGAFGPRLDYASTTSNIARIAISDVDRDGRRDVLVFSGQTDPPVWLRNEPGFALGSPQLLASAERSRVVTMQAADLNADGILDFTLSTRQDEVELLLSDMSLGTNPYDAEASVLLAQLPPMADVAWVDLDADGDLDVVGASESGEVYLSVARGFARWDQPQPLGVVAGSVLEMADLDGDGDMDIVSVGGMGRAVLLENTGSGTLTRRPLTPAAVSLAPRIEVMDMNGDGLLDLVGIGDTFGIVVIPQSSAGGGVFLPPVFVATLNERVVRTMVADVNQDGVPDISAVVQTQTGAFPRPRHLIWLQGLGAGSFAAPSWLLDGMVDAARPMALQLDGQGFVDFAWTSRTESAALQALTVASGPHSVSDLGFDPGGADARFAIGDLRGQGYLADVVVCGGIGSGFANQTLRHHGRNGVAFTVPLGVLAEGLKDVESIRLADLDGDGDDDILLAAGGGPHLSWVKNLHGGPVGTSYCGPAVLNSVGLAGALSAVGSDRVSLDDVTLRATELPPGSTGIFLASRTQGFVPNVTGSVGTLCLGGAVGRFQGPGQTQTVTGDGVMQLELDLGSLPQPNGTVPALPGTLWFFQAWYRDTSGGQPVSNFTDGHAIVFR